MSKIIFIAIMALTFNAAAKNVALVLGGSGDPEGKDTIFDSSTRSMLRFFRKQNYETHIAFDGNHTKTKQLVTKITGKEPPSFTKENLKIQIDTIMAQLKSGELKSGDQVMIVIDTHGARKMNDITHSVAIEPPGSRISLDELIPLKEALEAANIKTAFVDMSCHSGNTLALASNKTCVISGSPPDLVSFTSFAEKFANKLTATSTLESVFLDARSDEVMPSQPIISTEAGIVAQNQLQTVSSRMPINEHLLNSLQLSPITCQSENGVNSTLRDLSQNIRAGYIHKLEQAMAEYDFGKQRLTEIKQQLTDLNQQTVHGRKLEWWASIDFRNTKKFYREVMAQPNVPAKWLEDYRTSLIELEELERVFPEISASADFKSYKSLQNDFDKYKKATGVAAIKVTKAEREVYNFVYHQAANNNSTPVGPNPCREFTL